MNARPTALIADDEPLLRDALVLQLGRTWPELEIVAQARNGREAVNLFEIHKPDVCFLDVHMPGLSGMDAAHHIGSRAHVVFVTAYDHYAVQAFELGAADYLVKPVDEARLADTVARLQRRLSAMLPPVNTESLLQQLAARLIASYGAPAAAPLRWVRAQVGQNVRLIAVDEVDYIRSDAKYTVVAWRSSGGERGEAVVRMPLKELYAQLDSQQFVRVHRSVVVNLRSVSHVCRHDNETAEIHLKGRTEVLPVSRHYLHLFRQM